MPTIFVAALCQAMTSRKCSRAEKMYRRDGNITSAWQFCARRDMPKCFAAADAMRERYLSRWPFICVFQEICRDKTQYFERNTAATIFAAIRNAANIVSENFVYRDAGLPLLLRFGCSQLSTSVAIRANAISRDKLVATSTIYSLPKF